jgi:predicted RNA-binding protein (virulence factor B family)
MAEIGKTGRLTVVKLRDHGVYLDGGELGEILLPLRYKPERCEVGDRLEVFVYVDSDDTLVATTETPLAQVGCFASLKAVSVNDYGAFLDWGLKKDLLLPFAEQTGRIIPGKHYLVRVYLDNSERLAASQKLEKFLDKKPPEYRRHQAVSLIIAEQTDIGYKAIVDHAHWGVLYRDEVFRPLRYGQAITGYIRKVRPDGKIDLMLQQPGYGKTDSVADDILAGLRAEGGFLPLHDKSPPEAIYARFGISKKAFKLGLSALYRERLILIEENGIRLSEPDDGN